jgi:hypothetical protein
MENCCVFFEVQIGFLNIIQTSSGLKGLTYHNFSSFSGISSKDDGIDGTVACTRRYEKCIKMFC